MLCSVLLHTTLGLHPSPTACTAPCAFTTHPCSWSSYGGSLTPASPTPPTTCSPSTHMTRWGSPFPPGALLPTGLMQLGHTTEYVLHRLYTPPSTDACKSSGWKKHAI
jgi:hypothetical protein